MVSYDHALTWSLRHLHGRPRESDGGMEGRVWQHELHRRCCPTGQRIEEDVPRSATLGRRLYAACGPRIRAGNPSRTTRPSLA